MHSDTDVFLLPSTISPDNLLNIYGHIFGRGRCLLHSIGFAGC